MTNAEETALLEQARTKETALLEHGNRLVGWLRANERDADWISYALRGSEEIESRVNSLLLEIMALCLACDRPCEAELIPALSGLEGQRIEVEFMAGGRRLSGVLDRRQDGPLLRHVIRQSNDSSGEALTFGDFRVMVAARA